MYQRDVPAQWQCVVIFLMPPDTGASLYDPLPLNRRNNNGVIAKPASVKVEIATSGSVALLAMTIHLRAVAISLSFMT